jgi:hypothetical protein
LDEAVGFLLKDENEPLLPCLMRVIRAAASSDSVTPETWDACRLGTLRAHCVGLLETRLATPARADGDWSLDPPGDCTCEDCATLAGFLTAPDRTRLELPLAKPRRQHIHQALDRHGLPVRHETRRSGPCRAGARPSGAVSGTLPYGAGDEVPFALGDPSTRSTRLDTRPIEPYPRPAVAATLQRHPPLLSPAISIAPHQRVLRNRDLDALRSCPGHS